MTYYTIFYQKKCIFASMRPLKPLLFIAFFLNKSAMYCTAGLKKLGSNVTGVFKSLPNLNCSIDQYASVRFNNAINNISQETLSNISERLLISICSKASTIVSNKFKDNDNNDNYLHENFLFSQDELVSNDTSIEQLNKEANKFKKSLLLPNILLEDELVNSKINLLIKKLVLDKRFFSNNFDIIKKGFQHIRSRYSDLVKSIEESYAKDFNSKSKKNYSSKNINTFIEDRVKFHIDLSLKDNNYSKYLNSEYIKTLKCDTHFFYNTYIKDFGLKKTLIFIDFYIKNRLALDLFFLSINKVSEFLSKIHEKQVVEKFATFLQDAKKTNLLESVANFCSKANEKEAIEKFATLLQKLTDFLGLFSKLIFIILSLTVIFIFIKILKILSPELESIRSKYILTET